MPHGGTILDFPGQQADETIFIFARRYPLAFLPMLALILAVTLAGLAVVYLLGIGNVVAYNIQLLTGSAFLLFMLLFSLVEFFDFYFDLYIVTDRRIVDISQQKLFSRTVSELLLEDIEDVDAKTIGVLGTLFDFGDVEIQTAGSKANFNFEKILHPTEIGAIIIDLSDQAGRGIVPEQRHPAGTVAAVIDGRLLPHTPDHLNEVT